MKHRSFSSPLLVASAAFGLVACGGGGKTTEKGSGTGGSAAAGSGSAATGSAGATAAGGKAPVVAASRGPEHSAYSLVDNRLSAHLLRDGGLLVSGGTSGFAKYTRFGNTMRSTKQSWEMRKQQGDVTVARLTGSNGKLVVPLTADEVSASTVRVRAFNSGAARAFELRVNSTGSAKNESTAQIEPGWSTVEFSIPAGRLQAGDNEFIFFLGGGSGIDLAWLEVGAAKAPADGADLTKFYDSASKSLVLPDGGGLAYYVTIPDKAVLTGDLADGACSIAVTATGESGKTATGTLTGKGSGVALEALAGQAARVELVASGCASAELANAALVVPGAAPTVPRGEAPKHIVLFVMDSLRADRLRSFNPKARPESPVFDELAKTSALFTNFYVQGNESQVSHSSIWTSLYPIKHGKLGEKQVLDGKWVTVDEVAKSAGMYTVGVSANGYIRPTRGFGTGWDKFSNHIEEKSGLTAADVYKHGLEFLGDKKDPWFMYLGTIDTHVSWRAKQPWADKYDPGYTGRFADTFSGDNAAKSASLNMTEAEKNHVRALYDSNVSYQDQILGQLIQKLKDDGMWENTMLIITADHGDEQWEDGRVGHGASNRDMLIHVPLVIHYPPMMKAGLYPEGAESVDITPTVADALGVKANDEWQGVSLIPISDGSAGPYLTMAFNSQYEDRHAGRIGNWKVRTSGSGSADVYNLAADPEEKKAATGAAADIGGRVVGDPLWMLRTWNRDWKKSVWGNPANVTAQFATDLGE